jgi:translation initiation factor 1
MSVTFNDASDPFKVKDDLKDDDTLRNIIHLRIQQRNGRKTLTTIQGIPKEMDLKKLLKAFKKVFACNG